MNTLVKLGVASAMAFGAVAAHASITQPTSGASDLILFAEVLNSSGGVVASYGGDTGVAAPVWNGSLTTQLTNSGDAALSALFAADATGDTIEYAVLGGYSTATNTAGHYKTAGVANFATTGPLSSIIQDTPTNVVIWASTLGNTIGLLNTNLAGHNSVEATSAANGGIWDYNTTAGLVTWGNGNGPFNAIVQGTGATALYGVTGNGGSTSPVQANLQGTVNLTAAGLQLTAPAAVPVPAAVWLLGSGLLGLAGVARRKSVNV